MVRRATTGSSRTPSVELEPALIAAAERLLESSGPDALTVRRVAAEAGVAPMGVYNRFNGKAGMVDRLFINGFDRLGASVRGVSSADPLEALAECCRRYREFALRTPATYAVMFDKAVAGYRPSEEAVRHAYECFYGLVAHVERAKVALGLSGIDPVDAAQQIWAACHGQVSLELRGLGFVEEVDSHAVRLAKTVLRGLTSSPHDQRHGG
ncbi:MAG: TetR/AcrR family transcriptional regulator [Acidimicrobiales bacterium]